MKPLKHLKELAADSLIYGFSGMLLKLISLIIFPIFAHHFPPSAYGEIGVFSSLSLVLMTLSGLGLESASFRFFFDKEDMSYKHSLFTTWFTGRLVVTIFLIGIVYFFFRNWLIESHLESDRSNITLIVVLISLIFNIIPSILNTLFVIYKKALYSLLFSVCLTVLSSGLCLLFVFGFKLEITGFFLGQAVAFAIASIFGIFLFRIKIKVFRFDFDLLKNMTKYGLKVIPATLSNNFLLFFANLIILSITSQHLLGIFQVGYTIASVTLFFTTGFSQAFVPYSLSLQENEFKQFCIWSLNIYTSLMSFICFSISILYPEIINILFSTKYAESISVAGILTFSNFILSIGTIASISFAKTKKVGIYGIIVLVNNAIQLSLIYFLTTSFGIEGAAASFLLINFLMVFMMFYFADKVMPVTFHYVRNVVTLIPFLTGYFLILNLHGQQPHLLIKIGYILLAAVFTVVVNLKNFKRGMKLLFAWSKFKQK